MFDLYFLCLQRLGHSVGSYQRYAFVAESVGAMTNHTPPPHQETKFAPKSSPISVFIYTLLVENVSMFHRSMCVQ